MCVAISACTVEGRGVESLKDYSSRDIEEKTGSMKDESENGSRGFLYAL